MLTGALQRVSGERSATEELRHALVASESLAVLKPRLASVDAQIARECPPDRTADLQHLAERRSQLERHARPGRLTRAGRDDRRQLEEWGIEPEQLRAPPIDGVQYRQWQAAVKSIDVIRRLDAPHVDRGLDCGLGIGL